MPSAPGSEPTQPPSDDAVLHAAWRSLMELFLFQRTRFMQTAEELGLTPVHAGALRLLSELDACPMRSLAETLRCDASNVTSIVDRLEQRGLVERQGDVKDRRVKLITVTAAGHAVHEQLERALFEPPAALSTLSDSERAALGRLVLKLTEGLNPASASGCGAGPSSCPDTSDCG